MLFLEIQKHKCVHKKLLHVSCECGLLTQNNRRRDTRQIRNHRGRHKTRQKPPGDEIGRKTFHPLGMITNTGIMTKNKYHYNYQV